MIVRMIVPFLYSLLLGAVWSACTKKKFINSLAPAYMLHVILVLICGMVFKRLSIGIYGGIVIAIVAGVVVAVKNRNTVSLRTWIKEQWNGGVLVFLAFYIFCFVTNSGKVFVSWDEFMNWGMFLKESLRLDGLYCMSDLYIPHKDYVPAITLFETIWCKLSGRYAEADAYRAIQVLMFSLLMPMMDRVFEYTAEGVRGQSDKISAIKGRLFELGSVLMVLMIPLLFNTGNSFRFFHSIYCDLPVGVVFFWCVFEAYREQNDLIYHLITITIGMTMLVLSKMTSMALLPLVLLLLIVKLLFLKKDKISIKHSVLAVITVIVPISLWFCFNRFVDRYVENTGNYQSYDGMSLSSLKDVFISPQNSSIDYLDEVKQVYVDAILHKDILIHGSYVAVLVFVVVSFFILAYLVDDNLDKKKMIFSGIWTLGAGVFYCMLMYFLYCTAFSKDEALHLASYERYMNSFIVSIVLFLLAVYFDSGIWRKHMRGYYTLMTSLLVYLVFFHVDAFDQILPGNITHDEELVSVFTEGADLINSNTDIDDSVYIVRRGDNGDYLCRQRYYCSPRRVGGGSIGPAVYEGDNWSTDLTTEELLGKVSNYDYIYFSSLDEAFINKYSVVFDEPSMIVEGEIYKVAVVDSKITLE